MVNDAVATAPLAETIVSKAPVMNYPPPSAFAIKNFLKKRSEAKKATASTRELSGENSDSDDSMKAHNGNPMTYEWVKNN